MKRFKNSEFHEISKKGKIDLKFLENTNVVKFILTKPGSEEEIVKSDMIDSMEFYVRIIASVQLFNYDVIDNFIVSVKEHIESFKSKIPGVENMKSTENLVSVTGPIWKGKQTTSWINIDIPYIKDNITVVNECINAVTAEYRNYCEKSDIDVSDMFSIAKFLVKMETTRYDDTFNTLIIANYQKANSYVYNAAIRSYVPDDIVENSIIEVSDLVGCDVSVINNGDKFTIDTIFDDRLRFCEIAAQRFVVKSEKMVIPHIASRTVNIYKKDKTKTLIRNINGAIEVGEIDFVIKEHPKSTTFLADYIFSFFNANTKLSQKTMRAVSNKVGKLVVSKIISNYCKQEA